MKRNLTGGLILTALALGVALPANAQISFTTPPNGVRRITNGPTQLSAGDVNGDGINDLIVTAAERAAGAIAIGITSQSGAIESAQTIRVGSQPRSTVIADFNGDRINDIVVADFTRRAVFFIPGLGSGGRNDGRFGLPQQYAATSGNGPVWVTAGRFDAQAPLDVATANGQLNSFTVLANGGGGAFSRIATVPTGTFTTPRQILSLDVNGDQRDDILTLNPGTLETDEVALYLNPGTGIFTNTPQRFVVGVRANDMTLGDFNGDGRRDVAVLNRGGSDLNRYTISILLQDPRTGFRVLPPAEFACPALLNGVSVICTPESIAAADFDGDTRVDLAASFSTRNRISNEVTRGFIQAYAGRGDGQFDLASQQGVGRNPRGLVAADLNGDAIPDLGVAERLDDSVRVLVTLKNAGRPDGQTCVVGAQCGSGNCVDGVCCATISCPEGQRCDVFPPRSSEPDGTCRPPAGNGESCTSGAQCDSGACVDGFCCATASCPPGEFCNTGICGPPSPNGQRCNEAEQCASGFCTDGVCCSDPICALGAACNIPGSEGSCTERLPAGSPCSESAQCCATEDKLLCDDFAFCIDGFCCQRECTSSETCAIPGREGLCLPKPTATPTATPTPTPRSAGDPCDSRSQCRPPLFCTDGACCPVEQCVNGSCSIPGSSGTCAPFSGPGEPCDGPEDCTTGTCAINAETGAGVCTIPTPTPTVTPGGPGAVCGSDLACRADLRCNVAEGGICCNLAECPGGQSCRVGGREGQCTVVRETGQTCGPSDFCRSGNCVDRVCCSDSFCNPDERCDIPGFEGFCTEKGEAGQPCRVSAQCREGLICSGIPLVCVPAPTPTPTLPLFTPTPQFPFDTPTPITIRSGGCSVNPSGKDRGLPWILLTSLPLLVRPRRLRTSRNRQFD